MTRVKELNKALSAAKRVFVTVQGTEFNIQTTKKEIRELTLYVGDVKRLQWLDKGGDLFFDVDPE